MTAIEAIISNIPKIKTRSVIPESRFKVLLGLLKKTIENFDNHDNGSRSHFRMKVGTLNDKLLLKKIGVIFEHYEIPRKDFDDKDPKRHD